MEEIEKKYIKIAKESVVYTNIEDIECGEFFYYLGPVYMNIPVDLERIENGEYHFKFELKQIQEGEEQLLRFLKISDKEAYLVGSEIYFRIGECDEYVDYHNPNVMLKPWHEPCLTLSVSCITDFNDSFIQTICKGHDCLNFSEILEYKAYAEENCKEALEKILQKVYSSSYEQQFYRSYEDKVTYFCQPPKIGEYFGYVRDLYFLVPKNIDVDSNMIEFTRERIENKYPLLFRRISETEALEVTTGVKVKMNPFSKFSARFNEIDAFAQLCIDDMVCLELTERYKRIYGEATTDFNVFNKWLHEQESDALKTYKKELEICEKDQILKVYDVARVENALFDLDKKLDLVKKSENKDDNND